MTHIRQEILETAGRLIDGDRDVDYGDPAVSFARIAQMWSALLGTTITPGQVAQMMVAMKLSRLTHTMSHRDSWIDIAGYAALGAEIVEREA